SRPGRSSVGNPATPSWRCRRTAASTRRPSPWPSGCWPAARPWPGGTRRGSPRSAGARRSGSQPRPPPTGAGYRPHGPAPPSHPPADVREHHVGGAVDDVDAGLADADQVEPVPPAAGLLVVVAVEDAELRPDVLLAARLVADRLVRVAAPVPGDVLAFDIDD